MSEHNQLWHEGKSSEQIENWPDKDEAILNLHEDVCCLQEERDELIEALARCHHQASYSIGDSFVLSSQLEKVRVIANEAISKGRMK